MVSSWLKLLTGLFWQQASSTSIRISQLVEIRDLVKWFGSGSLNIALRTGEAKDGHHLVILDFDDFRDWRTWYSQTKIISYSIVTNRGKHVYLWSKEPVPLDAKNDLCEVKANGSVCLTAGSVIDGVERKGSGEIMEIERLGDILDIHNVEEEKRTQINITIPGNHNNITVNVDGFSSSYVVASDGDILNKIKSALPMTTLLSEYQPVQTGNKWHMAYCPGHDDKRKRSLSINHILNLAKCFNPKCPLSGRWRDVIGIHSVLNGYDMKQAIADLANEMGL